MNARVLIWLEALLVHWKCTCLFPKVSLLSLKSELNFNLLNCWCFVRKINTIHLFNAVKWGCFDVEAPSGKRNEICG